MLASPAAGALAGATPAAETGAAVAGFGYAECGPVLQNGPRSVRLRVRLRGHRIKLFGLNLV